MQSNEITERIKISADGIRINEILSIREELKKQIEEAFQKMKKINEELATLLPVRIDIPSCEKCGGDLSFADAVISEGQLDTVMFCKKCEPHE